MISHYFESEFFKNMISMNIYIHSLIHEFNLSYFELKIFFTLVFENFCFVDETQLLVDPL